MSTNDKPKPETKPDRADPSKTEKRGDPKQAPPLDFAKLDLTIEKVEERISPSETNVFDK